MNLLEQLLLWISYFNLGGSKWNILGILWLGALMWMSYKRFHGHFQKGFFPQPGHNPRSKIWVGCVIAFAFTSTFLLQMMVDDFITTPINLAFGSWYLIAPHLGPFTFLKLLEFKVDVYLGIMLYSVAFYMTSLWRFYHFTKWSMLWLSLTLILQVFLASQHIFYFLDLTGYDRIYAFWMSYPWFRIFTGLLGASLIKKPEMKTEIVSNTNMTSGQDAGTSCSRSFR